MEEIIKEFDQSFSKRYFVNTYIKGYFRYYMFIVTFFTSYGVGIIYALYRKLIFNIGKPNVFLWVVVIGFVLYNILNVINAYYKTNVIRRIEKYLDVTYTSYKYVFSPQYNIKRKTLINEWLYFVFDNNIFSEFELLNWLQNEIMIKKSFEHKRRNIVLAFLLIIISMNVEETYLSIKAQINELDVSNPLVIGVLTLGLIIFILFFLERMINRIIKDFGEMRYNSILVTYKELAKIVSDYIYLKGSNDSDKSFEIIS
ncbi:hypothetical protein [Petrocella sp. FN5]|uniref:hypothetical protein n=1 Tax=Petrocella sp. FN5 TaxID=3032002 RepID=UPI0023D9FAF1|nr:hypothetical protein [Petrocella sp. FN5]MDF1618715.1 hypothetical protein [Petrocella sp. FN5]